MRPCMKKSCCWGASILTVNLICLATCRADDLPIGHFTRTNYGDWKMTGTAFEKGPASDGLLPKLEIENAPDNRVASSEIDGDGPQGTLASPEFKIARKYISFLIGGGDYERHTCL